MNVSKPQKGFTLIELLVVVAIISLLSSVVLASLSGAREDARIAATVSQLKELRRAGTMYINDVGQFPPECRISCTESSDPFYTNPGVGGWDGPYFELWNSTHPWGGHTGFQVEDVNNDGTKDPVFVYDDDKPGTGAGNNEGSIPTDSLKKIDAKLDDGNLSTGDVIGDGAGTSATGEVFMIVNI